MVPQLPVNSRHPSPAFRQLQGGVALGKDVLGDEEQTIEVRLRDERCGGEERIQSRDHAPVLAD